MHANCNSLENHCNSLAFNNYQARKIKDLLASPAAVRPIVHARPDYSTGLFDIYIKPVRHHGEGFEPARLYVAGVPGDLLEFGGYCCIWCLSGWWLVLDRKRFFSRFK